MMRETLQEPGEQIVFGIGGAGCTVAAGLCRHKAGQPYYLLDTQPPATYDCPSAEIIQLGKGQLRSDPAAMPTEIDLERYLTAALPRIDAALLNYARDVLVIAALGGTTGRTIAPLIIERARLFGKTVHSFVWLPTVFEDPASRPRSLASLQRVMLESDATHIQNNDWLVQQHRNLCGPRFWGLVESNLVGQILKLV
jgi:cell division GTPase FtsZ